MSVISRVLIAPSILSADPMNFGGEVKSVELGGADWHHIDVMDGHFVPNLTYGLPLIRALKKVAKLPLDVHIMVSNPEEVAGHYLSAGADILVFHLEASTHPHRIVQQIHAEGKKAGIALNPGTPIGSSLSMLSFVDVVMLMSVNPGFGGQSFIEETINRVSELKAHLESIGRYGQVLIEVDGGINTTNAPALLSAGANILVAGTSVYGAADRAMAIRLLKGHGCETF